MLVDKLYPIYTDAYNYSKAETMNDAIKGILPKMEKLGITLPDYVQSGEKFIDYINGLTGGSVPYRSVYTNQESADE